MAIYQNSYEINRLFFHIVLIAICIPHVWILKLKYYDALETTINRYIEPKHSDWIATNDWIATKNNFFFENYVTDKTKEILIESFENSMICASARKRWKILMIYRK